jgi:hypothetical protein
MDDADVSQARMEAEQERLLAARQWSMLPRTGECYNCGEPTEERFCDRDCLTDWEQRQAANKRNGRG